LCSFFSLLVFDSFVAPSFAELELLPAIKLF
jgi:hypothetical protein